MSRFAWTWILVSALAAGCGADAIAVAPVDEAPTAGADVAVSAPFRFGRVAACLAEARAGLADHAGELLALEEALRAGRPPRLPRRASAGVDAPGLPVDVLTRFDGWWRGRWGDLPVEHLWWSVWPDTQLVVMREGQVFKRGINRLGPMGQLCGIVEDEAGPRLHEGHFRPARGRVPAYVEWRTPDRVYRERIQSSPEGRFYSIEEFVREGGLSLRRRARYRDICRHNS